MFYKKANRTIEEDLACFNRERFRNKRLDESVINESFTLTKKDKEVLRAFSDKEPASSKHLDTDGKVLNKAGMGGNDFAKWKGNKIVIGPDRPHVKSDEVIIRTLKKIVPKNWLIHESFMMESSAWDDRDDLLIESVKLDTNYINLLDKESVDFEFFNAAAKEIRKIAGDMADRVEVKGRGGKVYLWYEGRDVKGNDLQFMIHLTLVSDVKVYVYITGKRNRKSLGHGGGEKRMAEVDPAYIVWLYQFISDYQVR